MQHLNINIVKLESEILNAKKYFQLGIENFEKNEFEIARKFFQKSLEIIPDRQSTISNYIATLIKLDELDLAEFEISKGLKLYENDDNLYLIKGNLYLIKHKLKIALECYDKAIKINPINYEAYNNRGIALHKLDQHLDSITSFNKAIKINPNYLQAYHGKGNVLCELKRWKEAKYNYEKAISLNKYYEDIYCSYIGAKMQVCDWSDFDSNLNFYFENIKNNKIKCNPFRLLSLIDDPELHKSAASNFANKETNNVFEKNKKIELNPNNKIKLGYFSSDFHNHATAYLIAELLELHDKNKFEVYGFSYGKKITDEMRNRVEKSFNKFFDISNNSDFEVQKLALTIKIDIAIDLKGYTYGNRVDLFKKKCAPIQVSYLGYPGTLGIKNIDYIITDRIVTPEYEQNNFSEKFVYLPNCYQVNDSKKVISKRKFNKKEEGLPEEGFIFCCFNNPYKILPTTFSMWMRILLAVEGSVLWLLEDNQTAVENLRHEATKRGVNSHRLIFAKRMKLEDHLARHCLADLFLDTIPYNAHTTASDALWAGLPILTQSGNSFASRVAASILTSVGLTQLITNSEDEFEKKAIQLANNKKIIIEIKGFLNSNIKYSSLFDTLKFTQNLEDSYIWMYKKYLSLK